MQTENSNAMDEFIYGAADGSAGFGTVRFILYQNCASCHSYHKMSEAQLVADGVVTMSDLANSSLFHRLKGTTVGAGPKNMPPNGALTAGDIKDIQNWIAP